MTSSSRYRVFSHEQWARIVPSLPSNQGQPETEAFVLTVGSNVLAGPAQ